MPFFGDTAMNMHIMTLPDGGKMGQENDFKNEQTSEKMVLAMSLDALFPKSLNSIL